MKKLLIAYSTWAGATRQIAEDISKELQPLGFDCDVLDAKTVKTIDAYDSIILGTSIHAGQLTQGFKRFLTRFQKKLIEKKLAYFAVCLNMIDDSENNKQETLAWLTRETNKYPNLKPVDVGLFAGATLDDTEEFSRLNFFVKRMISAMKKGMDKDRGKSDFRNWEKIRSWAASIAPLL
jgi:menaquinone-dependent protoporphyrinogen oxidase